MATYYLVLTEHGSSRLAQAQAGTRPFEITQLAIGDANGQPYLPSSRINATALVHECARVDVTDVTVVGLNVEVAALVGSEIGGFNLHEIALLDDDGLALYLGNYHGGYRPNLTEGAGGDLKLILTLQTSGLTPVVIEMHPTAVVADRQWVIDHFVSIPTFNTHVAQNTLEHNNLLLMIQQLNQRVDELYVREEIQIGEFIITDDPRNPSVYKQYGDWRLIPNTLLKGLVSGGTAGQYSEVVVGDGTNVRTTFFWQRYDPAATNPLRTIVIDQDTADLNLLDLFVATYGTPTEGERVNFVISEDVWVYASSVTTHAIVSGDWPPNTDLHIDNYGVVVGHGGKGADGGEIRASASSKRGENGGNTLFASYPFSFANHGICASGGGGGGASENVRGGYGDGTTWGYGYNVGGSGGAPFGIAGDIGFKDPDWLVITRPMGAAGNSGTQDLDQVDSVSSTGSHIFDSSRTDITHIGGFGGAAGQSGGTGASSFEHISGGGVVVDSYKDPGVGGLAGIVLTGAIAFTGNPAIGR